MTSAAVAEREVMLCVGDPTFLDYGSIKVKREGYGPTGNGGNGLILHSALAVDAELGQPIGLLWQKLWNRNSQPKPPLDETPKQKKQRQATARKAARQRAFKEKESYRWVEALIKIEQKVSTSTRVIHVFDASCAISTETEIITQPFKKNPRLQQISPIEGCVIIYSHPLIAEVFDCVRQLQHTGVLIRAAHDRSLDAESERLWQKLESQSIVFDVDINLPQTATRKARIAQLAVRFGPVQLRTPYRFEHREPLKVYAVYATEIDCPEGETPVSWMLLTTEVIADIPSAATILRWYSYRWHIEEYHKIFKSGCQVERYRLAAEGMKTLLGFLSVIAIELLHVTYLHRTHPTTLAVEILNPTQIQVLKAKSPKRPSLLTVAWAVETVAYPRGYLEHRRKTPIGIQVLWRGWLKLHDLCEGWNLARET